MSFTTVSTQYSAMSSESSLFSDLSDASVISADEHFFPAKITLKEATPDIMEPIVPDIYVERLLQDNGQVTMAFADFKAMPRNVPQMIGSLTKILDLSHNKLRNLEFLTQFTNLHTLILDHNIEMEVETFPSVPTLKFLWLNNCKITKIDEWIHVLRSNCPELEHLSMMCNPGGSPILNGKGEDEDENYRRTIAKAMKNLKTLDGRSLADVCTLSAWDSCSDLVEKVTSS